MINPPKQRKLMMLIVFALAIMISLWAKPAYALPPFLYAVSAVSNSGVDGYTADPNTGLLTLISGSPFPIMDTMGASLSPGWIVPAPSGKFLYVANRFGDILGWSVDPTTGALRNLSKQSP